MNHNNTPSEEHSSFQHVLNIGAYNYAFQYDFQCPQRPRINSDGNIFVSGENFHEDHQLHNENSEHEMQQEYRDPRNILREQSERYSDMGQMESQPVPAGLLDAQHKLFEYYLDSPNKMINCFDFSKVNPFEISFGSCQLPDDESSRQVQSSCNVIRINDWQQRSHNEQAKESLKFNHITSIDQRYIATQLKYSPSNTTCHFNRQRQLFANCAENVKIYSICEDETIELALELVNNRSQYNKPIIGFDWFQDTIATVSFDSSLTIWDLNKQNMVTQVLGHPKEGFDICYQPLGKNIMTAGADGRVRLFQTNNIQTSNIIYQSPNRIPITKVQWRHSQNSQQFAITEAYSKIVKVFDIRQNQAPLYQLYGHEDDITCFKWQPNGANRLCTGSHDGRIYVWDFQMSQQEPLKHFQARNSIINMGWCKADQRWIAVSLENKVTMLRIM